VKLAFGFVVLVKLVLAFGFVMVGAAETIVFLLLVVFAGGGLVVLFVAFESGIGGCFWLFC